MRRVLVALLVIGCHRPAVQPQQQPATPAAAPAPACAAVDPATSRSDAKDIDGDGTPDLMVRGYRDLTIYLRRGDCYTLATKFEVNGRLAFIHVVERKEPGMRDLSIDTWLMHGDRKRTHWTWVGRTYASGFEEDIPGPRR